ncbi:MAG: hypothetical protein ACRC5H_05560 [Treponemataceae bacterium]
MKKILIIVMIFALTSVAFAQKKNNRQEKQNMHPEKMGEVSAIDVKAGTITFIDSDRYSLTAVINQTTHIIDITEKIALEKKIKGHPNKEAQRKMKEDLKKIEKTFITLQDIATGDWISVSYIDNGNKNLDAMRIQVIKIKFSLMN